MKTKKLLLFCLILPLLGSGCVKLSQNSQLNNKIMPNTPITTSDGTTIASDWKKPENAKGAILLLHMMPAIKESWSNFSKKLNNAGYATLAIDLRGHGKSDGGPDGYKNFSDVEHQASSMDVQSAINYIKNQGFDINHIYIAGASIGANLALQAMTENGLSKGILLSAGIDYRGIKTLESATKLTDNQSIFVVASEDDINVPDNDKMAEEIFNTATTGRKIDNIFPTGGHGTDILNSRPELIDELITWLGQE